MVPTQVIPLCAQMSVTERRTQRIAELDGIRGMAITMVLVWHYFVILVNAKPDTPLYYLRAAGWLTWTGVDLFFVLSGFLIGGILLDARDSPNYFRTFYVRRFFRIVPLYAVWFLLTLTVLHLAETGRLTPAIGKYVLRARLPMLPSVLYLQNFWETARNSLGWYSTGGTWSLAVEEQFYLTLPFVIRFAPRRMLPRILLVAIAGATLLRLAIFFFAPSHRIGVFVLMPCRADALLLGVLGAILVRSDACLGWLRTNRSVLRMFPAILAVGAAYLTKISAGQQGLAMSAWGYTWMAALYLCVILLVVTQPKSWLSAAMRWRGLRWMGTIAYGVYLLHDQVLLAVYGLLWSVPPDRLASFRELMAICTSLALTLAICSASWLYFEKPLVRLGHQTTYE